MTGSSTEGAAAAREPVFGHQHDLQLAREVLARDPAAIERFTDRLHCVDRILAARNRRHGGVLTVEDLRDLGQEVALTVYRSLSAYRGIGPLEAWIHSHCDHAFRNASRRRVRDRKRAQPLPDPETLPATATATDDGLDDPLHRCLQRLRTEEQWILHRHCHDNATLDEIARAMGQNVNTVKSRYTRALQQLRDCLGGGCR